MNQDKEFKQSSREFARMLAAQSNQIIYLERLKDQFKHTAQEMQEHLNKLLPGKTIEESKTLVSLQIYISNLRDNVQDIQAVINELRADRAKACENAPQSHVKASEEIDPYNETYSLQDLN